MDKELEILKNLSKYLQLKIDSGEHKIIYNDLMQDEKTIDCINAIETLIQIVENSISREVIERKLAKIEDKICGNDLYLGEKQSMKLELLGKVKQELLENKKRVGR